MSIDPAKHEKLRAAFRKLRDRNAELETALGESIEVIEDFDAKIPNLKKMQAELEGLSRHDSRRDAPRGVRQARGRGPRRL